MEENDMGMTTRILNKRTNRIYMYDEYGTHTGRLAICTHNDTLMNETYSFNPLTGNLVSRTNNIRGITETYGYDNLNRLTGNQAETVAYDNKGNITSKSTVGSFGYNHESKPYAITDVALSGNAIPGYTQDITYSSFHRPLTISENGITATFQYDYDCERREMIVKNNGNRIFTRSYFGDCYERDTDSLSNVVQRLYLGGDRYNATMVLITDSVGSNLYFILRDYLGSVRLITDGMSSREQELSYDAWGRLRNPETHEVYAPGTEPELMLGRGYTGHEHLPWFGLINMNARLYDPVLGRFLSTDPFVQAPDLSQNFNRYAYAMNNPFRYTDETGEFWWIVIGAVIGGTINVINKAISGDLHNFGDGLAAFGIGTVAGAVGGVTGAWAFGIAGGAAAGAGGFLAGAASGAVSSVVSAPILSGGNSLYFGDPFMSPKEYVYGILGGAFVGGVANGIVASLNGKNFFTGADTNSTQKVIAAYNNSDCTNVNKQTQQNVSNNESLTQHEYTITDRAYENFEQHFNSHNRNADLNLSTEQIKKNITEVIYQHESYFRQGDITMQGTINDIPKTIKINILGTDIRSMNLYPGYSNRANLKNPIIKFGDIKW